MDDWNIPCDDLDIIQGAREIGRYIVDNLGPSDIAAVVFPRDAGNTEDFTSDRSKLIDAINKFDPHEPDRYIPLRPSAPGGGGGDMPYRFSPALMRTECERAQPTVPTLEVVVAAAGDGAQPAEDHRFSSCGGRAAVVHVERSLPAQSVDADEERLPDGAAGQHQHLRRRSGGVSRLRGVP